MENIVIVPRPPICIKEIITTFPKADQVSWVFKVVSPVTAVAELAVKSASTKLTPSPFFVEIGKVRRTAPNKITKTKDIPNNIGGFFDNFS